MAVRPNAAIAPYVPSAVATPNPEARPTTRPSARVRRMTSRLIGPTAAAIVKPRTKPRSSSDVSMIPFLTNETPSAFVPRVSSSIRGGRPFRARASARAGPRGPLLQGGGADDDVVHRRGGWGTDRLV